MREVKISDDGSVNCDGLTVGTITFADRISRIRIPGAYVSGDYAGTSEDWDGLQDEIAAMESDLEETSADRDRWERAALKARAQLAEIRAMFSEARQP